MLHWCLAFWLSFRKIINDNNSYHLLSTYSGACEQLYNLVDYPCKLGSFTQGETEVQRVTCPARADITARGVRRVPRTAATRRALRTPVRVLGAGLEQCIVARKSHTLESAWLAFREISCLQTKLIFF